MSSEEVVKSLLEMGFTKIRAEKALEVTGHQGVEPAMEWLLAHTEDEILGLGLPPAQPAPMPTLNLNSASIGLQPAKDTSDGNGDSKLADTGEAIVNVAADAVPEAKSLKCDDCGKLFKTQLDVEYHAAKSGHSNFSESTQEKKPLTEEEKREQLRKLEEKMKLKRLEREQAEREEAFEREKHRIKTSKEISAAKKKLEDAEMKKLIEQRKREKLDEKLARQRVKDQIEQDKIARRARPKYGATPGTTLETEAAAAPTSPPAAKPSVHPPVNYSQTKLQIRLTNGQILTQTFGSKEELSAVRLFISINRTDAPGPFSLMTSFPKKVFTESDFSKPLDVLGLVPSAVVIVSRIAPVSVPSVDSMDGMLD